jgi:integrase
VLGLTWDRVDFGGRGRVWLDGSMTKNGQPRSFKMTADLRTLLEARKIEADNLKQSGRIVSAVFFRERLVKQPDGGWLMEKGQPILSFIKAWRAACVAAGLPGRIYHGLRRSAIRNFVRAGVSESVSIKLSGHLTASTFRRYNITADSDFDDAADKLDVAANTPAKSEKKTARVHRFTKSA